MSVSTPGPQFLFRVRVSQFRCLGSVPGLVHCLKCVRCEYRTTFRGWLRSHVQVSLLIVIVLQDVNVFILIATVEIDVGSGAASCSVSHGSRVHGTVSQKPASHLVAARTWNLAMVIQSSGVCRWPAAPGTQSAIRFRRPVVIGGSSIQVRLIRLPADWGRGARGGTSQPAVAVAASRFSKVRRNC